MFKHKVLSCFLMLLFCSQAYANETLRIGLSTALEMAKNYDQNIKIAKNELEQADWSIREARSSAFPTVNLESSWQYNADIPTFGDFSLTNKYEHSATISVNQALYTFGTISSAIKAANQMKVVGQLGEKIAQEELLYNTTMAYYTTLMAKEQLKVAQNSLNNAKKNLEILEDYTATGRIPRQDYIRLQADIASREPQVEQAKNDYQQSLLNLKRLTGVNPSQEVELTTSFSENFPEFNRQRSQKKLLENEPRLKSLEEGIKLQANIAETQRVQNRPRLAAFASRTFSATDNENIIGSQQKLNATAVGLSLTWDIWDGGARKSQYEQALIEKRNKNLQKDYVKRELITTLNQMIENYQSLKKRLPSIKRSVELAERSFELSQNRFSTGETTVTELNDVESLLTQSKIQKIMTIYELYHSRATIERLMAKNRVQKEE